MKKHVGMSRFQIKETCFVPLSLIDALSDLSPVEPWHSRVSLILEDTLLSSKPNSSIVTLNESKLHQTYDA